jgi:hypothetical protein
MPAKPSALTNFHKVSEGFRIWPEPEGEKLYCERLARVHQTNDDSRHGPNADGQVAESGFETQGRNQA